MELIDDSLRLIVMRSFKEQGQKVDDAIKKLRGIKEGTFIVPITETRFGDGEAKVRLDQCIRGKDVFILTDTGNHNLTYKLTDYENHMSPDDHYQDGKRAVAAVRQHAERVHMVMPKLHSGRQDKREGRESLDCAVMLQELIFYMHVHGVITIDAHNSGVSNAIPINPFENLYPTHDILYDFITKESIFTDKDLKKHKLITVSTDLGGAKRTRYYANMLRTEMGIFDKSRDPFNTFDGLNPILDHNYIGPRIKNKIAIVTDDIIASGGSMLEVAEILKAKGIYRTYLTAAFAQFTKGQESIDAFNNAYNNGIFEKLYTTNLSYVSEKAKALPWLEIVDCTPYLAEIIDTINTNKSLSVLIEGRDKIQEIKALLPKQKQKTLVK